jgi:FdhE protein
VARNFLDRWLGRSPAPEVAEAVAELERLSRQQPALSGATALLADLLPGLCEIPSQTPSLSLTVEGAAAKLAGGIPLLRGEEVSLSPSRLRRRWAELCAVASRHQPCATVHALAEAVRSGRLAVEQLAAAVFAGRVNDVHARTDSLGLDAGQAAMVLRLTLFPFAVALGAVLGPLRSGLRWEQGYCPVCGSWPLLGEFRGLEQARWLRCGLCASGWEFPRLACPYCGTRDHRQLGYLHVEGEEGRRRAATCEACRGHVKMLATLGPLSVPQLLVADVTTLPLDLAAAERGYAVPG